VSKLFGSFAALRQVSVDLEPGRCYVLLGENGAGKSTLLRILAGLLRPSFGTVRVFGAAARSRRGTRAHRLHEPRAHALRRADRAGEPALLREPLSRPPLPHARRGAAPGGPRSRAEPALRPIFAGHAPAHLAGPRAAALPELLLLDEPFSNMDVESARQMVELLAGFRQSDRTIVLTTHQRELAAPIADWVLTLHAGRVASFEPGRPTL
jgi:ABC-type sulfate/molybdate transport systems ATPase subunit